MQVLTIDSLGPTLDAAERAALVDADLIIGVDAQTAREFTVFGMPSLESSVTIKRPSAMRTVRVILDCNSGELEELVATVQTLKGLQKPR